MAKETNPRPRKRRPAQAKEAPARKKKQPRRAAASKPKQKTRRIRPRIVNEFKPDSQPIDLARVFYFTQVQRTRLLRWSLYIAVCLVCLIVQDCIMSRIHIFGSTTDLAVAALMLIAVIEGSEVGSVFILVASCIYYFSGSAPGPYSVGMLSVLGLAASLIRQQMWHRNASSILLCACSAVMTYEIGLYAVGLFLGLTRWYRFPRFFMTGLLTSAVMIPLYHLINRIGTIGGYTWKE